MTLAITLAMVLKVLAPIGALLPFGWGIYKTQCASLNRLNQKHREFIDWVIKQQQSKNYERGWVVHYLNNSKKAKQFSLQDWKYAAQRLGYSDQWAFHQYQEHPSCKKWICRI